MKTLKQAAQAIGICETKLRQFVNRREIAFYRVGGKYLFADADIQAFLNGKRTEARQPTAPKPRPKKLRYLSLD